MKTRYMIALLGAMLLVGVMAVEPALADLRLPNYAQNQGLEQALESKGRNITNMISMVVAIIAIIGMLIGAGYFGVGNKETGTKFLVGGVIALVIAGTVFGIAQLVVG